MHASLPIIRASLYVELNIMKSIEITLVNKVAIFSYRKAVNIMKYINLFVYLPRVEINTVLGMKWHAQRISYILNEIAASLRDSENLLEFYFI